MTIQNKYITFEGYLNLKGYKEYDIPFSGVMIANDLCDLKTILNV